MDTTLLIACAATLLLLILGFTFIFRKPPQNKAENRPRAGVPRPREGVPRRAQLARNRGGRQRVQLAQDPEVSENEDDANTPEPNLDVSDGKLGAKKRAKLEAKAEKKAQREAEEVSRAEKKKKEQQSEIERKKAEELQKAEEQKKEEIERNILEEKKRQEHEEYLKMKETFLVEEEGFEEEGGDDEINWLQEFLNYIKMNKVVIIEDLAAQFKLKSQAAIDRIKDLQRDDILTGVIDDRGKFIYVSEKELQDVAKFIRQRGRVSISELVENSNKLINLVPVSAK